MQIVRIYERQHPGSLGKPGAASSLGGGPHACMSCISWATLSVSLGVSSYASTICATMTCCRSYRERSAADSELPFSARKRGNSVCNVCMGSSITSLDSSWPTSPSRRPSMASSLGPERPPTLRGPLLPLPLPPNRLSNPAPSPDNPISCSCFVSISRSSVSSSLSPSLECNASADRAIAASASSMPAKSVSPQCASAMLLAPASAGLRESPSMGWAALLDAAAVLPMTAWPGSTSSPSFGIVAFGAMSAAVGERGAEVAGEESLPPPSSSASSSANAALSKFSMGPK
mmetsp:Transcript_7360/g.23518  ORF Transcript_7360/g.23518 Transcript_7360/m.23518 type:complete len:288 (+) Transcript_7360:227-1090(+)